MTWNGERLRQLLREERTLLRELALMLVATLVVGVTSHLELLLNTATASLQ